MKKVKTIFMVLCTVCFICVLYYFLNVFKQNADQKNSDKGQTIIIKKRVPFKWNGIKFNETGLVKNIVYPKAQKTGSTTWRSVLLAYGNKYNLKICLDARYFNTLNWPYNIYPAQIVKAYDEKCTLIADEMVYNKDVINSIMEANPFFLFSVRDPIQQFLSLFKFKNIGQSVKLLTGWKNLTKWQEMEIYIKNYELVRSVITTYHPTALEYNIIGCAQKNVQIYTLNIDNVNVKPEEVEYMANEIDHFILAEYSMESLVILHRKLNCPMSDLFYIIMNRNRGGKEQSEEVPMYLQNLILEFNDGDLQLYKIAEKRLFKEISNYKDFDEDLKKFESGLEKHTKYCNGDKKIKLDYETPCKSNVDQMKKKIKSKLEARLQKKMRIFLENWDSSKNIP